MLVSGIDLDQYGRLLGHVDVSVSIRPHQLVHQVAGVIGMSQRIVSLKLILPDGKLIVHRMPHTYHTYIMYHMYHIDP